jgi:hypothetical protein
MATNRHGGIKAERNGVRRVLPPRVLGQGMANNNRAGSSGPHGAMELPSVIVDSYNLELRNQEGFIGDRASKRAFVDIVEDWRERLRRIDDDPLGSVKSDEISKKKFELLLKGSPEAAGLVHGAIEEFAGELALVMRKFLPPRAGRTRKGS